MNTDAIEVTLLVASRLEELGIDYVISGSIASSLYGYPRTTYSCDIVADIRLEQVTDLIEAFQQEFYVSDVAVDEAIRRHSSFNLIHLSTSFNVDIFVQKDRIFDRHQLAHGQRLAIDESGRRVKFSTAEDVVLAKLERYRLGGESSSRQWRDIMGILEVQADALDRSYLDRMAVQLRVGDLLERAYEEAATD